MIGERILRAGAAVVAGFVCAWEHLRTPPGTGQIVSLGPHSCPACGESLTLGPHVHDDLVIWATDHADTFLLTDMRGGQPTVVSAANQ